VLCPAALLSFVIQSLLFFFFDDRLYTSESAIINIQTRDTTRPNARFYQSKDAIIHARNDVETRPNQR